MFRYLLIASLIVVTGMNLSAGAKKTFSKSTSGLTDTSSNETKEITKKADDAARKAREATSKGDKNLADALNKCAYAYESMRAAIIRGDDSSKQKAQKAITQAEENLTKVKTPPAPKQ